MGQQKLVRVTLKILQDYALFLAIQFNGQDVREEGFVFQSFFQLVVPDGNRSGFFTGAINDGRNFTLFATQAAARTSPWSSRGNASITKS